MTTATSGRAPGTARPETLRTRRSRKRPPATAGSKHGTTEDPRNEFSDDEWHDMVSTAAYYRAEPRGFDDDSAQDDWYEAEAELRERFRAADSDVESVSTPGGVAANIETTEE